METLPVREVKKIVKDIVKNPVKKYGFKYANFKEGTGGLNAVYRKDELGYDAIVHYTSSMTTSLKSSLIRINCLMDKLFEITNAEVFGSYHACCLYLQDDHLGGLNTSTDIDLEQLEAKTHPFVDYLPQRVKGIDFYHDPIKILDLWDSFEEKEDRWAHFQLRGYQSMFMMFFGFIMDYEFKSNAIEEGIAYMNNAAVNGKFIIQRMTNIKKQKHFKLLEDYMSQMPTSEKEALKEQLLNVAKNRKWSGTYSFDDLV